MGACIGRVVPESVSHGIASVIPSRETLCRVVDSVVAFEEQLLEGARDRLFPSTSESKQ